MAYLGSRPQKDLVGQVILSHFTLGMAAQYLRISCTSDDVPRIICAKRVFKMVQDWWYRFLDFYQWVSFILFYKYIYKCSLVMAYPLIKMTIDISFHSIDVTNFDLVDFDVDIFIVFSSWLFFDAWFWSSKNCSLVAQAGDFIVQVNRISGEVREKKSCGAFSAQSPKSWVVVGCCAFFYHVFVRKTMKNNHSNNDSWWFFSQWNTHTAVKNLGEHRTCLQVYLAD